MVQTLVRKCVCVENTGELLCRLKHHGVTLSDTCTFYPNHANQLRIDIEPAF